MQALQSLFAHGVVALEQRRISLYTAKIVEANEEQAGDLPLR